MSSGHKYEVDANGVPHGQPPEPTQKSDDPYNAGYNQPSAYGQQPPAYGQQHTTYGYPISTSTNVVVTNNVATPVVIHRGSDWLVPAVLSCLFCFWPTGICAIMAAVNARIRYEVGDHAGGQSSATRAMILTLISLGVGLVYISLLAVMYFTVWQSEKDRFGFTTRDPFNILEFTTKNPWDF
ncbi:proline-rich transmembrane protein 2-like isoform X6 [Ostrea edulis]|uniref:proline-rich transmembrane protein 2-like isoform X6 n=1 Tax=Ostrea edulis TaxID=37623 RepID=UPI0024AF76DB|nr:proline-rich transmembrane protein 2-like isoform X6 [Ostrea edulis]